MLHRLQRAALSALKTPFPWLFAGAIALVAAISAAGHFAFDAEADREVARQREVRLRASWDGRGWVIAERSCQGVRFVRATRAFELDLANGRLTGGAAPDEGTCSAVIDNACLALGRYPSSCLRRIGFDAIVLASDLREGRLAIPSLPNVERSLLLDASTRPGFVPRLVHHETMHFVDWAADHRIDGDPAWEALNRPGFSYGGGGRSIRAGSMSTWSEAEPGFVTGYATSSVAEDKAELFALSMDEPGRVRERASRDPMVATKLAALAAEITGPCPELESALDPTRVDATRR